VIDVRSSGHLTCLAGGGRGSNLSISGLFFYNPLSLNYVAAIVDRLDAAQRIVINIFDIHGKNM
jgi:hypothetical protein